MYHQSFGEASKVTQLEAAQLDHLEQAKAVLWPCGSNQWSQSTN